MNFLSDINISDETINVLNKKYTEEEKKAAYLGMDDIFDIIEYFRNIGIKRVEELLISDIHIFMCSPKIIDDALKYIDIDNFVNLVNIDINNIYLLDEYKYL